MCSIMSLFYGYETEARNGDALPITGGTVTGAVTFSDDVHFRGNTLDFHLGALKNVAAPVDITDAANKRWSEANFVSKSLVYRVWEYQGLHCTTIRYLYNSTNGFPTSCIAITPQ